MDVVLGVSMAPSAVRMVLVEGAGADGTTVDDDHFAVEQTAGGAAQRVAEAILGTQQGAREGGYRLTSTGVTWTDQVEAVLLRDALAHHKVEDVMLVSAFLAAAALAQAVGNVVCYTRTGLLFIEPDIATLAVVDSADGSLAEVHRRPLPDDDDRAVAELAALVASADQLAARPDGVFVVGSGVDVAMIKPELDRATPLPVTAPAEPEMALAHGAALASAHAPLFTSSTRAIAWAQDPDDGSDGMAYGAVPDVDGRGRKPFLVTGSALAGLFVVGVVALAVALAVSIRPTGPDRPQAGGNVVIPARHEPVPAPKPRVSAPPPVAPAPAPAPAPLNVPAPAPAPAQAPAPVVHLKTERHLHSFHKKRVCILGILIK